MVAHQAIGMTLPVIGFGAAGKDVKKITSILVIDINVLSRIAAGGYMI